jgi:DNA-binding NtrC family response regulator
MGRILLMDSDHSFRKTLWLALVKLGYEVVEATNGKEAVRLQRYLPADVLMTDVITKETEGLATIREFKRSYPTVKIFGIGVCNDLASEKHRYVNHMVNEPFSVQELVRELEGLVGTQWQNAHLSMAVS